MTVLARRSSLLLVFALTCVAILLVVNTQQASSASWKTCSLSSTDKKPNKHGPTYLKKLKVKGGPTCAGGKSQVKKWFNCRTAGPKGDRDRCNKKIDGYTCKEDRSNQIPTSFDAAVNCRKGSKYVSHRYQQLVG